MSSPEANPPVFVKVVRPVTVTVLRGKNLIQAVYSYLLTIPPASVEVERAFSSVGVTCTRMHSHTLVGPSDDARVLDDMLFMHSYFQSP
jgi:hypothetical protein